MPNVPRTLVRSSHSITIRARGETVGLISNWTPGITRTITGIYELRQETSGNPIEKVPGNVAGLTIGVSRYDIYPARMEVAFGTADLMMLSLQDRPFDVIEKWLFPQDQEGGRTETIQYTECWFSNIGRTHTSDGDRIVKVNATLEYVSRELV